MDLIRQVAVCVFRKDGRILLVEGYDHSRKQIFFRPLGGEIAFGERGENTIRREIRKVLSSEVVEVKYLGLLENIFTFNDQTYHELVLVYEGRLSNPLLYEAGEMTGNESGEENAVKVVWKRLDEFGESDPPLYPDGLLRLMPHMRF